MHIWFWCETAAGKLISGIADRVRTAEGSALEPIAFGIAR